MIGQSYYRCGCCRWLAARLGRGKTAINEAIVFLWTQFVGNYLVMRDNGTGTSGLPLPLVALSSEMREMERSQMRRETGRGNPRLAASRRVGAWRQIGKSPWQNYRAKQDKKDHKHVPGDNVSQQIEFGWSRAIEGSWGKIGSWGEEGYTCDCKQLKYQNC